MSILELAFRTMGGVSRGTAGLLLPGLHRAGVADIPSTALAGDAEL